MCKDVLSLEVNSTRFFAEVCRETYHVVSPDGVFKGFPPLLFYTHTYQFHGTELQHRLKLSLATESWCSRVHGLEEGGSKAKSLLKDTVVSLFYQQTGHFSMCWIRCNFPTCFMAISDPWALVSKLLKTDIISNIRRTLAILWALKGPTLPSVLWMA